MARSNLVSEFMRETISYGGEAWTRHEVYQDLKDRCEWDEQAAQRYAFGAPVVDPATLLPKGTVEL